MAERYLSPLRMEIDPILPHQIDRTASTGVCSSPCFGRRTMSMAKPLPKRQAGKVRMLLHQDTIDILCYLGSVLGVTPANYDIDPSSFIFVNFKGPPETLPRGAANAISFQGRPLGEISVRLIIHEIGIILQADVLLSANSRAERYNAIVEELRRHDIKVVTHRDA